MGNTHTLTSREFVHNVSAAKRLAAAGPVFITDRGQPAFALLSIEDYRRMSGPKKSMVELLSMPEAAEFEIEPIQIGERELGV
ncbi:MAG: type II toxin-antitoxin system Phd/YefM family antitoxin [Proteobacteria bacterium]|nr:type II toxin-antitoxin system Phd/YefM family antitoxin [Pseudomonadota bacterium]